MGVLWEVARPNQEREREAGREPGQTEAWARPPATVRLGFPWKLTGEPGSQKNARWGRLQPGRGKSGGETTQSSWRDTQVRILNHLKRSHWALQDLGGVRVELDRPEWTHGFEQLQTQTQIKTQHVCWHAGRPRSSEYSGVRGSGPQPDLKRLRKKQHVCAQTEETIKQLRDKDNNR